MLEKLYSFQTSGNSWARRIEDQSLFELWLATKIKCREIENNSVMNKSQENSEKILQEIALELQNSNQSIIIGNRLLEIEDSGFSFADQYEIDDSSNNVEVPLEAYSNSIHDSVTFMELDKIAP